MWLREILKRWVGRTAVSSRADDVTRPAATLLEELAVDGEDFADLAAALRVDLRDLVATLVAERPTDPTALVAALRSRSHTVAASPAAAAGSSVTDERAVPRFSWASWGGGEGVGWARWTRVRGGTRVQRAASATAPPPALAAP
jgi:hypothetical protein